MNSIGILFLITLCVIRARDAIAQATTSPYRLPRTISPVNYEVELTLSENIFQTNVFEGVVRITLFAHETTREIHLHAHPNISFVDVRQIQLRPLFGPANPGDLRDFMNSEIPRSEHTISLRNTRDFPAAEIIVFTALTPLQAGGYYLLVLPYTALLRTQDMWGFYRSSYLDENGNVKYLATTQFQPTFTRRAFPCFDEPSFKATFDLTIRHPSNYEAIAGTPVVNLTTEGNLTTTVFRRTPLMSTYLVAFLISEFTCTRGVDVAPNYPYQVCSRSESNATRGYALDIGPPILWDLENYTSISYNISNVGKLDQVALPDFAAGAMENWGLVTYREIRLLWDPLESSNRFKQQIAILIAHEILHKWFGNLVTTHWWSDTFLNEGFANYYEYYTTGNVETTWEMDKQYVIDQLQPMLQIDSLISSQPLSSEVSTPAEILGRFTQVSYNKGGSVLRMVRSFMGSDAFRAALHRYLITYAFNNTVPSDLWNTLDGYALNLPTNLTNLMANWTYQAGFPLLEVESNGTNVFVNQTRFLLNGTDSTEWYVPISYTTARDPNQFVNTSAQAWLIPGSSRLILNDVLNGTDWFIINNQRTGYYRVNYDQVLWDRISAGLQRENFDGIIDINRAQIVDDLFNLAKIGKQSYARVLQLTSFLANDTSYYPWWVAFAECSHLLQRTGNVEIRNALSTLTHTFDSMFPPQAFILNQTQSLLEDVPFNVTRDDDQIFTLKKVLAWTWACNLGSQQCISNATNAFRQYRSSGIRPNPNLRLIVYCNGLRHSNNSQDDWQYLWDRYNESQLASEKATTLQALGCTTNRDLLNRLLLLSITQNSGIRSQDGLSVFSSVHSQNPEGVDIALDFLIANYQGIINYYASLNSILSLINGISARFTNSTQLNKLESTETCFIREDENMDHNAWFPSCTSFDEEEFQETLETPYHLQNFLQTANLEDSIRVAAENAVRTIETNLAWTENFERELITYFNLGRGSSTSVGMSFIVFSACLLGHAFYSLI